MMVQTLKIWMGDFQTTLVFANCMHMAILILEDANGQVAKVKSM